MGRVGAPFGVRGWLKVQPFSATAGALLDYATWWLARQGRGVPVAYRCIEGREHGASLVAKLEGVENREEAAALRGAEVLVARSALPDAKDDEVYWSDLVGCAVVNLKGEMLGTVTGLQDFGAHPILFVARADGGERLIPFVPAFVQGVDLEAKRIEVDWEASY